MAHLQPKRILFVAYGGAHVQMALPVIRSLKNDGHDCIVMALTTAQPVMRQLGMEYIGFKDILEAGDTEAITLGKILANDLPTPPLDAEETYAYLGLSYCDLRARLGEQEAKKRYSEKGRYCFEPITVMERVLKKYVPDLLVISSAPRAEKAAAHAARNLRIPTACMIDFFGMHVPWADDVSYADKLLVFSEMTRQHFSAQGRPANDMVVTGNPAMDRLADPLWKEKGKQWRKARGWENKKIIFWASHAEPAPNDDLPARIDAAVLQAVAAHDDWRMIMRFHPGEVPRFSQAGEHVYMSPKEEEFTPLLYACDVCIVINSTVGLEAAMIGRPMVTVDMSVYSHLTPFAAMGISLGVTRIEQIEACLKNALARGHYYPPGLPAAGNATKAVAETINAMLRAG